ncbi:EF-hand domain-containing protein [Alienimonas chondri]|uniref:EF-hand domain-containing protein n=1 Tax=Alienimonas chondri TaxID=2681879 RepID=A0ABX1VEA1_9PLAN|nr:EF-hand domain-containing protein [Alienimonas chondri]NNJ25613.1 hypothetical protein [Alienimonas chondri]
MFAPLAAAVLLCGFAADDGAASSPERVEFLVLAPNGPLRIAADVTVDRRPFTDSAGRYRETLMSLVDADGDGRVTRAEAARTPTPRVLGGGGDANEAVMELLALFDEAGEPGMPVDRFRSWVEGVMGPPVRVRQRFAGGDASDVVGVLDADGDGRLTPEELRGAAAGPYDFDADGTLSAAELAPFRSSAQRAERRHFPPSSPFRLLTPVKSPGLAADLAERYGTSEAPDEPHLVISVRLIATSFGLPRLSVIANHAPERVSVAEDRRSMTLTIDSDPRSGAPGLEIELAADRVELLGSDAISLGLLNMVRADGDANGYLDMMEFPAANLPGAPEFADVDRDGDEQATREEVRAFLEEDLRLANSRIYLLSEAERSELFGLLDADDDGRLTPAERSAAAEAFASTGRRPGSPAALDRDRDGAITADELVGRFTLHLGPGRPPDRPPSADELEMIRGRDPGVRSEEGPEWFRRSDRNGDGALTWAEFVGPRDAFDRFDGDGDGTLTPAEASGSAPDDDESPDDGEEPRRGGESLD